MIFRQLFDQTSGTYSYLLASRRGGEALIIDPVLEKVDRYLSLVRELDLKLVKAVDTHMHADHITGLGALRDKTHCITVMGEQTKADVVSMRLGEGDKLTIEGLALDVIYTPGHTDDSYSFVMPDRVFTGDTLLRVITQHMQALPAPPSERTELPIPATLDELVLACLAKKPEDRPQTARQLAQSLDAIDGMTWGEEEAGRWWSEHHPRQALASDAITR